MISRNTYKRLIWVIVILLATNLSMGLSFLYHKQQDRKLMKQTEEEKIEVPAERRTRFFREQLNLRFDQMDSFRELNRNYNRTARLITDELKNLRIEMVTELGEQEPGLEKLDSINTEIGRLHSRLKNSTVEYYLGMKKECDAEQQKKLNEIFMSMLKSNDEVKLPQRKGRFLNTE